MEAISNHSAQAVGGGKVTPPKRENPTSGQTGRALNGTHNKSDSTKSTAEMLDSLRGAMLSAIGHAPQSIQATSKLERFDTAKHNDKCGWYVCHLTRWGMVARFGNWREGATHEWTSFEESSLTRSDFAELKRIQQAQAQARRDETARRHESARERAVSMWCNAKPASHAHPYLMRKQIGAWVARQCGELLLVPLVDLYGNLHNIQTITANGEKRFLFGGRKKGLFCLIGERSSNHQGVIICEGYATGASIHEAYGLPVLVAMDKGNLLPVAKAYRARYLSAPITVCADNDRKTAGNPGLSAAREVCASIHGVTLIVPEFDENAPLSLSDFNDAVNYYRMECAV